jgi:hypothetical protein
MNKPCQLELTGIGLQNVKEVSADKEKVDWQLKSEYKITMEVPPLGWRDHGG